MHATHSIDASGKSLGRVAAEAAKALMGKRSASYTPNVRATVKVSVSNAGKIRITERKRGQKIYTSYSGHPGGLKKETLASLSTRLGMREAVRRAVRGMLPNNTIRPARLKNLEVTE